MLSWNPRKSLSNWWPFRLCKFSFCTRSEISKINVLKLLQVFWLDLVTICTSDLTRCSLEEGFPDRSTLFLFRLSWLKIGMFRPYRSNFVTFWLSPPNFVMFCFSRPNKKFRLCSTHLCSICFYFLDQNLISFLRSFVGPRIDLFRLSRP